MIKDSSGKVVDQSPGSSVRWVRGIVALVVLAGSAIGFIARKASGG